MSRIKEDFERRGNFHNDLLSVLLYTARIGMQDRSNVSTGRWVTLEELSLDPPNGVGIPRATLNYLFWFEGKGTVVRRRKDTAGQEYAEAHDSVMDRIAAKYGISYKIRRIHIYPSRDPARVPCNEDHPTDEWEISAVFVEPPQDQEWNRFIDLQLSNVDKSFDAGFDGEDV